MELKVIESTKKRLKVNIKGVGHTFCNALVDELWKNKNIESAAYAIRHPLKGDPELIVETKGNDPKKVIHESIKKLHKANEKSKNAFLKALK